MDQLHHDWLTEGLIDFEYKKYILLAYLKDIRAKFSQSYLYPFMADLVFHMRNLEKIRNSKQLIYEHFPKTISKADFEKLKFNYQLLMDDDEVMSEIETIISYAIPRLEGAIEQGMELYDFVEQHIEFEPVGLASIYQNEGYLFVSQDQSKRINIYRYQVSLFEGADEKYRAISTTFVRQELKSFSRPFQRIKLDLVKLFKDLPNPATYLATSKFRFPEAATVLPIAKRFLIRSITPT